ncbi:MAG: hypothetical protein ABII21_01535 [bacterium]
MITPIIMDSEIDEVERKLSILRRYKVKKVHFDIGDGLFSELLTVAPADLQQFELTGMEVDIHLLVDDPTEWIKESVALSPRRLIGQIERMGSQAKFLETVAGYGASGGLALKIETPITEIEREVLQMCKTVLLLAIPAGTTGSPFDERVLTKIWELRKIYLGDILIDGGINKINLRRVLGAGATEAGANSAYWRGEFG